MGVDEIFTIPTSTLTTKPIKITYNCDIEEAQNSIDKISKKLDSLTISSTEAAEAIEAAYAAMRKLVVSSTPSIFATGKFYEEGYLYQTSLDFNTIGKEPEEEEWPLPF